MDWIIGIAVGCIILGLIANSDLLMGCGCGCLSTLALFWIIGVALVIAAFSVSPVLGVFVVIILILISRGLRGGR